MFYLSKTPKWVGKLFTGSVWELPQSQKTIYLSFDDGPHPIITPFVLNELGRYNAKATFFCIGKNVESEKEVFNRILAEGHAVGNHTYDHLNGWKTNKEGYLANVLKAKENIPSNLFRPPYGKMTVAQYKLLTQQKGPFKVVMWSVLSGDFDLTITKEHCCNNVLKHARNGSIIVFHDSEKAKERMQFALPLVLQSLSAKGYVFKKMEF